MSASAFTLRDALGWLDIGVLHGRGDERLTGVCTDSRRLVAGQLFVALRGERFDAHDFVAQAGGHGAAAVMIERPVAGLRIPTLRVPDTRRALGELARGWRRRFAPLLIAVTGSNGKTTVKEMLAAILAQAVGSAHRLATSGNLNNEVGVPLTIFGLRQAHRAAVVELGMNRPGEIAWLAEIAQPQVVLVNNAQREHQEFMGSVEATARENGSAFAVLPATGVAVFPVDDPHAPIWRSLAEGRRVVGFGYSGTGDPVVHAAAGSVPAQFAMRIGASEVMVRLAVEGRHNVRNALAAAAAAHAGGIAPEVIATGLAAFQPPPGRLVRVAARSAASLVDDSYNANPDSVRAAIDVLAQAPAPRLLVLGDMGEVGEQGPAFHREVGAYAARRGIEQLFALGAAGADTVAAFGAGARHFPDLDTLLRALDETLDGRQHVLVKGSRFMRMERVVAALAAVPVGEAH
ncbi:MAG: UDP-N-acetylmuramoyl-tripeptide--D-alanyl-D-alanine ligase [Pseudomonadota bacterium]|nr:UDP-N-acetylmuramoyl-tripeptide--D-alanyl-D-alanine ligase [Pseudomonadota bacterium]